MRFSARTASSVLVLVASLGGSLAVGGCTQEQPKSDDTTQAKKGPAPIPSDFVLNDFFNADAAPVANATMATGDGGVVVADDTPPAGAAGAAGGAMGAGTPPAHANVKVVDPGADPKVQRRYHPTLGKADTLKVALQTTLTREAGGQKQAMAQPTMTFTLVITPKDKAPDGSYTFDLKLAKADVAPPAATDPPQLQQMAKGMAMALKALSGTAGTFRIDARGSLGAFALTPGGPAAAMGADAANEVAPLIQQALESVLVEFPEDAIGKGAHWTDTAQASTDGVNTAVAVDSVLTDVAGDDLTVTVKTTRTAPPQAVPDPRAPKGSMLAVTGTATSTVHTHLDHLVKKANGDSSTHVTVNEPAGAGGQPPQVSSQTVAVKQSVDAI